MKKTVKKPVEKDYKILKIPLIGWTNIKDGMYPISFWTGFSVIIFPDQRCNGMMGIMCSHKPTPRINQRVLVYIKNHQGWIILRKKL